MPNVRGETGLEFSKVVLVDNFPLSMIFKIQEESIFRALHGWEGFVECFEEAGHVEC